MNTCFVPIFFNLGGGEISLILLIILVVFGPSKIPEMARQLGRAINEMKKASTDITREFRKEADNLEQGIRREVSQIKQEVTKAVDIESSTKAVQVIEPEPEEIPDVYMKNDATPEKPIETTRKPIL